MPVFSPNTISNEYKLAFGTTVSVAAADVIATGLAKVVGCIAVLESDPVLTMDRATAVPHATQQGKITVKGWMPTSVSNPTPIAATTFTKRISWWAWGY